MKKKMIKGLLVLISAAFRNNSGMEKVEGYVSCMRDAGIEVIWITGYHEIWIEEAHYVWDEEKQVFCWDEWMVEQEDDI